MTTRRQRGFLSQEILAEHLRANGFPGAESCDRGRHGRDILGIVGVSLEVKATASADVPAWLRQAERDAGDDLAAVVWRMRGQGPADVDAWPVILRLGQFRQLLQEAGY